MDPLHQQLPERRHVARMQPRGLDRFRAGSRDLFVPKELMGNQLAIALQQKHRLRQAAPLPILAPAA